MTSTTTTRAARFADWTRNFWEGLRVYFGTLGRRRKVEPVADRASLRRFLETRASYVAQTSLYGYVRTRAGMLYPQLFDDDNFVRSLNIAKWHVWLACLGDLSVYTGGLLVQHPASTPARVGALMQDLLGAILEDTGSPEEAGEEFRVHADRIRARVAACDWTEVTDDESPFSTSPPALIKWAPIVDYLKDLDEAIVVNSVRFRWQEIRRDLRGALDAEAVLRSSG